MNPYCKALGIAVPELKTVQNHREASTCSLLNVALLERGQAMTLVAAARRFEEVGIATADCALPPVSLKRFRRGLSRGRVLGSAPR